MLWLRGLLLLLLLLRLLSLLLHKSFASCRHCALPVASCR
jgi:hypothetical protein